MNEKVWVSPFKQPCGRIATLLISLLIMQSCKGEQGPPVPPAEKGAVQPGAVPAPTAPPSAVAPVTQAAWAPDALEELLAPIALYPDPVLAQILAASINSQEVLDGGNWLLQNQNLKGKELDTATEKVGFGPAMRALVHFPTVVDMMCQEIDWTKQIGSAFSSDQKSVLDAVQRLRKQATDVGNLKSTPQQTVSTKSEGGNTYVEVKPADPQIVYVPQYDAQAVYTEAPPIDTALPPTTDTSTVVDQGAATAPPPTTTPSTTTNTVVEQNTTIVQQDDGGNDALLGGVIGFGVGMVVGSLFNNNDDYYYPNWGGGGMYYGGRPFYPPAYAYRPAYGGAFRPAYGYNSPAGYRNSYNNIRGNNNVVVNNKNYYNRFDNNQNLRAGNARSPIAGSERPGQRPGVDTRQAKGSDWKGQSTYAGARDKDRGVRDQGSSRPGSATTREARPGNNARPSAGTRDEASRVDRGKAESRDRDQVASRDREQAAQRNRDQAASRDREQAAQRNRDQAASRDREQAAQRNRDQAASRDREQAAPRADRGFERPAASQQPDRAGLARSDHSSTPRNSAFSGAESRGGGNFERSASARGNASAGSRQTASRPSQGSRRR